MWSRVTTPDPCLVIRSGTGSRFNYCYSRARRLKVPLARSKLKRKQFKWTFNLHENTNNTVSSRLLQHNCPLLCLQAHCATHLTYGWCLRVISGWHGSMCIYPRLRSVFLQYLCLCVTLIYMHYSIKKSSLFLSFMWTDPFNIGRHRPNQGRRL